MSGRNVTLSWSTAAPTTGVTIEAGGAAGQSDLAVLPTAGVSTVTINAVPPGTYHVRIRAQNHVGASDPSNEVVVVVP